MRYANDSQDSSAPRVSIGLPVYNGEKYLADAITSVLEQTYSDFELLISDNASTDATQQICEAFAQKDSRIRYHRLEQNVGAAGNFNLLVERARGSLFKWAAHDDLLKPEYLESCVAALDADPEALLAHSLTVVVDEQGTELKHYRNPLDAECAYRSRRPHRRFAEMVRGVHACYEVFGVIRTSELRATNLIGPFASSDRVLLAELSLRGKFVEVPEVLFVSRDHQDRSIRQYRVHDYAKWFDSSKGRKIALPHWRLHWEYGKAIFRAKPGPVSALKSIGHVVLAGARNFRRLASDLAGAVRLALVNMKPAALL